MTTDRRAPVIRLLTAPEAAGRLGVALVELDRLVDAGTLAVLRVSARDGRRFWPADVDTVAVSGPLDLSESGNAQTMATSEGEADVAAPTEIAPSAAVSIAAASTRRRPSVARHRSTPERPRWPGFAFAPHRVRTAYLAFRDPEHVASYLQARKSLQAGS